MNAVAEEDVDGEYHVGETYASRVGTGDTVAVTGQITKRTTIDAKLLVGVWECRDCRRRERVQQAFWDITPPMYCDSCEKKSVHWVPRKNRWQYGDYRKLRLKPLPEEMDDDREHIDAHLTGALARRDLEAGDQVTVVAEFERYHEQGKTVATDVLDAEAVFVDDDSLDEDDLAAYREQLDEIAAAEDPIPTLVDSVATDHFGDQHLKEALLLLLVRGNDAASMRGTIHMMLLGDPGTGKTDFGEALVELAPRGKKASGNSGTSAAGLTAAITRDDFSDSEFTISAGAIPQCSGGAVFIDELDSADETDQEAMLEAMESQVINIQKAGREATLEASTAVLSGANPEDGNFREDEPPHQQTNVPSPLLTRFDLMFVTREREEREEIANIAGHIIDNHDVEIRDQRGLDVDDSLRESVEPEVEEDVLRAYLAAARQLEPVFASQEVKDVLETWYVETKTRIIAEEDREFPVTPRSAQDLIRLAEASAKLRHSETVDLVDAERATRLKGRSFRELGLETPAMEVETDEDGNLVADHAETPTAAVTEAVEELKMQSSEYGADPEAVAVAAAETSDLSVREAEALVEDMIEAGTLSEVGGGRLTA
ncbi:ATP-binding protein [Haloplanus salilacus]|uniref:ATP-binding protein n=1 Tax=Haloplanus salilacus TaxID=2949994 RepID=UPI0030D330E8